MILKTFFLTTFCCLQLFCVDLKDYIETIPDFPSPGVQFKWYPKLLKDPEAFQDVIMQLKQRYLSQNLDAIVGLDSRGFVFGAALAYEMKLPFVMIRKKGKLPKQTLSYSYQLEYGSSCFEIEADSLDPSDRVIIIDDILATGGSLNAASYLVQQLKAHVVELVCLIELKQLNGKDKLSSPFFCLLSI